jgi:large subunit ribosomal protein L21
LLADGDKISVGAPAIDGAQVGAKVLKHFKGNKVIVFKKKRRKGYRVKNGHRQALTEIIIDNILSSGAKKTKKVTPKSESKKVNKPVEVKKEQSVDLSKLTVAVLKDMAKAKGITGISSMKKGDLVKALS